MEGDNHWARGDYWRYYADALTNGTFEVPFDLMTSKILPQFNPELLHSVVKSLTGTVLAPSGDWMSDYLPAGETSPRNEWLCELPYMFDYIKEAVVKARNGQPARRGRRVKRLKSKKSKDVRSREDIHLQLDPSVIQDPSAGSNAPSSEQDAGIIVPLKVYDNTVSASGDVSPCLGTICVLQWNFPDADEDYV
jgi:hypothetical protein